MTVPRRLFSNTSQRAREILLFFGGGICAQEIQISVTKAQLSLQRPSILIDLGASRGASLRLGLGGVPVALLGHLQPNCSLATDLLFTRLA